MGKKINKVERIDALTIRFYYFSLGITQTCKFSDKDVTDEMLHELKKIYDYEPILL